MKDYVKLDTQGVMRRGMKGCGAYPDRRDRVGQKTTPHDPPTGVSGYMQDRMTSRHGQKGGGYGG